jgi:hypothetical protein
MKRGALFHRGSRSQKRYIFASGTWFPGTLDLYPSPFNQFEDQETSIQMISEPEVPQYKDYLDIHPAFF